MKTNYIYQCLRCGKRDIRPTEIVYFHSFPELGEVEYFSNIGSNGSRYPLHRCTMNNLGVMQLIGIDLLDDNQTGMEPGEVKKR